MDSNQFMNVQPAPAPQKKGSGKALFMIIGLAAGVVLTSLIACVVMMFNSKKTPAKVEGAGYDSAEEAVAAYINFLKEGNLEGAISTFAVESYVEKYDMKEFLEWVQYYGIAVNSGGHLASTINYDSDFSRELNIESRRSYIIGGICNQVMAIAIESTDEEEFAEAIVERGQYTLEDDDAIDSALEFLATDPKLEKIELGDRLDEDDLYVYAMPQDRYLDNYEDIWASDIELVTYEVEVGRDDFTLFMYCVCYDGKWYIADFNNYVGISLSSGPFRGLVPNDYLYK